MIQYFCPVLWRTGCLLAALLVVSAPAWGEETQLVDLRLGMHGPKTRVVFACQGARPRIVGGQDQGVYRVRFDRMQLSQDWTPPESPSDSLLTRIRVSSQDNEKTFDLYLEHPRVWVESFFLGPPKGSEGYRLVLDLWPRQEEGRADQGRLKRQAPNQALPRAQGTARIWGPGSTWSPRKSVYMLSQGKAQVYAKQEVREHLPVFTLEPYVSDRIWEMLAGERESKREGKDISLAPEKLKQAIQQAPEQTPAQVRRKMSLLLRLAETDPEQATWAEARARALLARHRRISGLSSLVSRLSRSQGLSWQEVDSVYSGLGIRYVQVPAWSSQTPFLRVRKALLGPKEPGEEILAGGRRLVIRNYSQQATRLTLELEYADMPFLQPQQLVATYQVDQGQVHRAVFSPQGQRRREIHLDLGPGEHLIRVGIARKVVNQFIRIRVTEPASSKGMISGQAEMEERRYYVAGRKRPLRAKVMGPAWLRIDQWEQGQIIHEYRYLTSGPQEITLTPSPDHKQALYRLYVRARQPGQEPEPLALRESEPQFASLPDPSLRLGDGLKLPLPEWQPDGHGRYEDGTWSFSGQAVRRRNLFEGGGSAEEPGQFFELSGKYRRYFPLREAYVESSLLTRYRESGGPTLGTVQEVSLFPDYVPFNLQVQAEAYLQNPQAKDCDYLGSESPEWSVTGEVTGSARRKISPTTWHRPSLSLFGRVLSMDGSEAYAGDQVDQDVYTPYKADHLAGLTVSEALIHQPWLDTIWSAQARVRSNEHLALWDPDHISLDGGWEQLIGPVQLDMGYRATRYFPDQDRQTGRWRHYVSTRLSYDHWRPNQDRLQLSLGWTKALDRDDGYSAWLGLTWHLSRNQGLQDFEPGDPQFSDLMRQRFLQKEE
mgnify:FL=1